MPEVPLFIVEDIYILKNVIFFKIRKNLKTKQYNPQPFHQKKSYSLEILKKRFKLLIINKLNF
jgi:hypothetical protein